MSDAEIGAGDIEVQLDGAPYTLKPTLEACMAISRIGGGLQAAVQRCINLDMETICDIIAAGLSANPTQRKKMIPELVFKTGLIALSAPCIEFIHVVGNGGRPLPEEEAEAEQPPFPETVSPSETITAS